MSLSNRSELKVAKALAIEPAKHMDYFETKRAGSYRGAYLHQREKRRQLKSEDAYTLHFPIRKKFQRERVVVSGIDAQFQADLMDLQKLSKYNRGYRYILVVICIFSKYAWLVPIKKKTGSEIVSAFKQVFDERLPLVLQTDRGSEFKNTHFQSFLKEKRVRFFFTKTELKSSIVERLIRTIKAMMWRFFTRNNTLNYLQALKDFAYSYNHTKHRSIGMAPVDVTHENQEEVWQRMYGTVNPPRQPNLTVGTTVRISKIRNKFEKSSLQNWKEEIFYIVEANRGDPPVYRLRDYNGEPIDGRFYREELQVVKAPEFWRVEKVIKRRKRNRKTQYLVRWKGYGPEFDSWVERDDIEK